MQIDAGFGLVDFSFENPPAGADLSPGEHTVLAVARAVAHADLDDHEFALIAYDGSAVDLPFNKALWNLVTKHLHGQPSDLLRTLVVVAESRIDVGLHCQHGSGFRFAVDGDALIYRHLPEELTVAANQIANQDDPLVLFLAAGFSASSRLPLGNSLRDSAIRRMFGIDDPELYSSESLAERFYEWIADKEGWLTPSEMLLVPSDFIRRLTLEQVIRAEKRLDPSLPTLRDFRDLHDDLVATPGTAVVDCLHFAEMRKGKVVLITVNFDLLLETHQLSPLRVFSSDDEFVSAADYIEAYLQGDEVHIPLLKLHGSIDRFDTCVVSAEQTEQGIGHGKLAAVRALLQPAEPRLWVYVGSSMRDRDLLRVLGDEDFARGLDERWVSPYLEESVRSFALAHREPFWRELPGLRSLDDRLVTETADAFFFALRDAAE